MRPKDQVLEGKTEHEKLTVLVPKLCGLGGVTLLFSYSSVVPVLLLNVTSLFTVVHKPPFPSSLWTGFQGGPKALLF